MFFCVFLSGVLVVLFFFFFFFFFQAEDGIRDHCVMEFRRVLFRSRALVDAKRTSVLLITHNLGVVRQTTDRVYVMYAGSIAETAPTADLFSAPKHPYTQGLLASVPKLTGEGVPRGIDGMIPDYLNPPPGCRFAPRCQFAQPRCQQPPPWVRVGADHDVACVLYDTAPAVTRP